MLKIKVLETIYIRRWLRSGPLPARSSDRPQFVSGLTRPACPPESARRAAKGWAISCSYRYLRHGDSTLLMGQGAAKTPTRHDDNNDDNDDKYSYRSGALITMTTRKRIRVVLGNTAVMPLEPNANANGSRDAYLYKPPWQERRRIKQSCKTGSTPRQCIICSK